MCDTDLCFSSEELASLLSPSSEDIPLSEEDIDRLLEPLNGNGDAAGEQFLAPWEADSALPLEEMVKDLPREAASENMEPSPTSTASSSGGASNSTGTKRNHTDMGGFTSPSSIMDVAALDGASEESEVERKKRIKRANNRKSAALSRARKKVAQQKVVERMDLLEQQNRHLSYLVTSQNMALETMRKEVLEARAELVRLRKTGAGSAEAGQTPPPGAGSTANDESAVLANLNIVVPSMESQSAPRGGRHPSLFQGRPSFRRAERLLVAFLSLLLCVPPPAATSAAQSEPALPSASPPCRGPSSSPWFAQLFT